MILEFDLKKRKQLKITDQALLSIIKKASINEDGFKMTNEEIMDLFNLSKGTVNNSLNKLRALGLIYNHSFDGKTRVIKYIKGIKDGRETK